MKEGHSPPSATTSANRSTASARPSACGQRGSSFSGVAAIGKKSVLLAR